MLFDFYKKILYFTLIFIAVSFSSLLADNKLTLQEQSSLFDERGFSKNFQPTNRLNISPVNGNVLYTYPISTENIHGAQINFTLTYNANVNYVSFDEYLEFENRFKTENVNKSSWILGVNDFAVQVLVRQDMIYPDLQSYHDKAANYKTAGVKPPYIDLSDVFNNWGIEGYHFCKRTKALLPLSIERKQDEIKLLKSDGSVLCLKNGDMAAGKLDIGRYYCDEVNNKGYGIVEYLDSINYMEFNLFYANMVKNIKNKDIGNYTFSTYNPISKNCKDPSDWMKFSIPRKLRYFPGDGYEYEFIEYIAPYGYGALCYLDKSKYSDVKTVTPSVHPTIFYLTKIRYNDEVVSTMQYGMEHFGQIRPAPKMNPDSSILYYNDYANGVGRANCVGVNLIDIIHGDNYIWMHNDKKNQVIQLDLIREKRSLNSRESNNEDYMMGADYSQAKINNILKTSTECSRAYYHYDVSKIKVNRIMTNAFEYGQRTTKYFRRQFPTFPIEPCVSKVFVSRMYLSQNSYLKGIYEYDNNKYTKLSYKRCTDDTLVIDYRSDPARESQAIPFEKDLEAICTENEAKVYDDYTKLVIDSLYEYKLNNNNQLPMNISGVLPMKIENYQFLQRYHFFNSKWEVCKTTNLIDDNDNLSFIRETFGYVLKRKKILEQPVFQTLMLRYDKKVYDQIPLESSYALKQEVTETEYAKENFNSLPLRWSDDGKIDDLLSYTNNTINPSLRKAVELIGSDTVSKVWTEYEYKFDESIIRKFENNVIGNIYSKNYSRSIQKDTKYFYGNLDSLISVKEIEYKSYPVQVYPKTKFYISRGIYSPTFSGFYGDDLLAEVDTTKPSTDKILMIPHYTYYYHQPILPLYNEAEVCSFEYRRLNNSDTIQLMNYQTTDRYWTCYYNFDYLNYYKRHSNFKPHYIKQYKPQYFKNTGNVDAIIKEIKGMARDENLLSHNHYKYTSAFDDYDHDNGRYTILDQQPKGWIAEEDNELNQISHQYKYYVHDECGVLWSAKNKPFQYQYNDGSIEKFDFNKFKVSEAEAEAEFQHYSMVETMNQDNSMFNMSVITPSGRIRYTNNWSNFISNYEYDAFGRIQRIINPGDFKKPSSYRKYGESWMKVVNIKDSALPISSIYQYSVNARSEKNKVTKLKEDEFQILLYKYYGKIDRGEIPVMESVGIPQGDSTEINVITDEDDRLIIEEYCRYNRNMEQGFVLKYPDKVLENYAEIDYYITDKYSQVKGLTFEAEIFNSNAIPYYSSFIGRIEITVNDTDKITIPYYASLSNKKGNTIRIDLQNLVNIQNVNGNRIKLKLFAITQNKPIVMRKPRLVLSADCLKLHSELEESADFTSLYSYPNREIKDNTLSKNGRLKLDCYGNQIDIYKKIDDEDNTNSYLFDISGVAPDAKRYGRYNKELIITDYNQEISYQAKRNKTIEEKGYWGATFNISDLYSYKEINAFNKPKTVQTNMTDSIMTTQYTYDALGRPVLINEIYSTYSTHNIEKVINYNYAFKPDIDNIAIGSSKISALNNIETFLPLQYERISQRLDYETDDICDSLIKINVFDAIGNKRQSIVYSIRENMMNEQSLKNTYYNYNLANQLIEVINPAGQQIRYWYDDNGKVKYVYQPDMGLNSSAYDKVGNLRFFQNQKQADESKMTFYQYDDKNRIHVVGEALLPNAGGKSWQVDTMTLKEIQVVNLNRLTDIIKPDYLHIDGTCTQINNNPTIFNGEKNPEYYRQFVPWQCVSNQYKVVNKTMGVNIFPLDCMLYKHITEYNPKSELCINSDSTNFENIEINPQNIRMVYIYDKMPESKGNIFNNFPNDDVWNSLTLEGNLRNQLGKVAAIAYRDNDYQNFNYVVYSYDERGRVEAVIKLTDNIGFDAVYYKYNSQNSVLTKIVSDMNSSIVTWYGYDYNGNIDSVWTSVQFGNGFEAKYDTVTGYKFDAKSKLAPQLKLNKNIGPVVAYSYKDNFQIDNIFYPAINTCLHNEYDDAGRVIALKASMGNDSIFSQNMNYDLYSGNIKEITNKYNDSISRTYQYEYDALGEQLGRVSYILNDSVNRRTVMSCGYDILGNRKHSYEKNYFLNNSELSLSDVHVLDYEYPQSHIQPNAVRKISGGPNQASHFFNYYSNGAVKDKSSIIRADFLQLTTDVKYEKFDYDYRGLTTRFFQFHRKISPMNPGQSVAEQVCPEYFEQAEPDEQWQYSYSPFGERESKRQIATAAFSSPKSQAVLSNCYYLLGQGNEQLAVYYGYTNKTGCYPLHDDEFSCCKSWAETAYYYLGEYNIYAPGGVPITFKVNEDGTDFHTIYKIQDYLGNVRAVVNQDMQITGMYDYMPFGEQVPVSLSGTKDRLSFIGKENDVESGLGDFGVRKYDNRGGRFLSIDPLWEEQLAWSPYHYCGNNPVNGKDPSGLLPGDPFDNIEIAAHDFGKNYNALSIQDNKEISTTFYEIEMPDGKKKVTYRIPREFGESTGKIFDKNGDIGMAHTHGAFIKGKDNNNFSEDDLSAAQDKSKKHNNPNWRSFLFTTDGSGKEQNLITGESKVIFRDMPRDSKDPETKKNRKAIFVNTEQRTLPLFLPGNPYAPAERKLP